MHLLKTNAEVAPSTFFATLLNAPCSSLLLTNATEDSTVYLVVGKSNGETVFFPTDRSESISKYECDLAVPIAALVAGDLRNTGKKEVVTITSNGVLQSLSYPCGDPPCPTRIFCQQIYANICFAEILDVDNDGYLEFLVAMTDRVVRSYRFSSETDRLIPLNKWEMPSHVSSCCMGLGRDKYMLLSLCDRDQYVCLDFNAENCVHVVQTTGIEKTDESDNEATTLLILSSHPYSTLMFHCLAERILVVNREKENVVELNCFQGGVVCATTVKLLSGLVILVTVDLYGQMLIYGWTVDNDVNIPHSNNNTKRDINCRDPIARCQVSRDVDYICGFPGPQEFSVTISIVNIYNKIAIFLIDLSHIIAN